MSSILIVDDVEINRLILREILSADYDILEAESGLEAIDLLYNIGDLPQAVLLDIMMPGMDGFEVLSMIKSNPRTDKIPVLFITAADASTNESKGLKEGAADYISKPFNPDVVKARVESQIQLKKYRDGLEIMLEKKTDELITTHERTLETLATIIEYRSLESGTHIRRSSELSRVLIHALLKHDNFKKELVNIHYNSIIKAVALHDIGKIGIPDSILLKPGKLTDEEFAVIKEHTLIGSKIIETIAENAFDDAMYLTHCREICRYHHERWDGKGYPDKLSGLDIPLSARILSIVDVYDALVNERCYKPAMSHEAAMDIIREGIGTQFDPDIGEIVLGISDKFKSIEKTIKDEEQNN